jgi:hypothetical protein
VQIEGLISALEGSAIAHAVSKSDHMVGAGLQILHIGGFVLLLSSLVLVSLRLLGKVLVEVPVERVAREARRLSWLGLALALSSGVLIFIATPRLYVGNLAFQAKLSLFVVASIFQLAWFRRVATGEAHHPAVVRFSVAATLVLWFGVGFAGRVIGFI